MDSGGPKRLAVAVTKSRSRRKSSVIIRLGRRFSSVNDKTTISVGAAAAAARSRIVVCYHNLLHTLVQRLMAGSPGAASEGCCQGEECSPAALRLEVVYTTATARTRVRVVRREEDAELMMAESKNAPDAPAHNRTRPAPADDEHARVLNRAGEALCPRIVWPARATTKTWAYGVRPCRSNDSSQT